MKPRWQSWIEDCFGDNAGYVVFAACLLITTLIATGLSQLLEGRPF